MFSKQKQSERDRWHHEQVHRGDAIRVIAQKRLPALGRRPPPPRHVFCHTGLPYIDAELQKLTVDPRSAPQGILDAHLPDQATNF